MPRERMISTAQVQMEFMKDRQNVILLALKKFKFSADVRVLPVIADAAAARTLKASKRAMDDRRKLLKQPVERIVLDPARNDPVLKAVQSLFVQPTPLILGRENEQRFAIRRLARKRWLLTAVGRQPCLHGAHRAGAGLLATGDADLGPLLFLPRA